MSTSLRCRTGKPVRVAARLPLVAGFLICHNNNSQRRSLMGQPFGLLGTLVLRPLAYAAKALFMGKKK